MEKLDWPTLFCNSLKVAPDGAITGYQMRVANSKLTTVKALQSAGFQTIAAGDSYNDLGMMKAGKAGFLSGVRSRSGRIIRIFRHLKNMMNFWQPLRACWIKKPERNKMRFCLHAEHLYGVKHTGRIAF